MLDMFWALYGASLDEDRRGKVAGETTLATPMLLCLNMWYMYFSNKAVSVSPSATIFFSIDCNMRGGPTG